MISAKIITAIVVWIVSGRVGQMTLRSSTRELWINDHNSRPRSVVAKTTIPSAIPSTTPAARSAIEGHVEIRWTHGRFSGAPEAKVHLDTHPHAVAGYFPLV